MYYLISSSDYLTKSSSLQESHWTRKSGDNDSAAQQRARGAPEPPQQPCLGAADIRRVAAEPLVMVARDQQALFGGGAGDHPRQEFQAVAQPGVGIGRAGVAKNPGAGPVARRDPLDELRGLLDPAAVEHGTGVQEHQPRPAGLAGAGGERRGARALEGEEAAAGDVGDPRDR